MLRIFTLTHFNDALPGAEEIRSKLIATGNGDLLKIWDQPLVDCIDEGYICDILPSGERYFSVYAWGMLKGIEPDPKWCISIEQLAGDTSLARNIKILDAKDMYVSDESFPMMYSEQILEQISA